MVRFQQELVNTSSRLQTLISSMHSGILAENTNRQIILTNQIFCDIFKIPLDPDSMKGMDCSDAAQNSKHLFEDEAGFVERIDNILMDRKRIDGELLKMKDGSILERDFLPIYEKGDYIGHIWKYQDVTQLINSKESLKKVEDKYSRIIENLELGLIEVDLEERITKVYPAFSNMTGYSDQELLGKKATDLLALAEDHVQLHQQNELRKQGLSSVYETKIRAKDGSVKYLIISGAPIYDMNNDVVGSLGVHVDISERKKLEEELINANEKALSSVKIKDMFVANMSHEIRTPMNVIIGMLDLIGDEGLDPERKKYMQTIKRSANALLELINDLLDFSKIESGKFHVVLDTIDLEAFCNSMENMFQPLAQKKSVDFSIEKIGDIPKNIISDEGRLEQVIRSLVSNAFKFTENGHVKIIVRLPNEKDIND